jgi:diaminohydroxyphosphoribosylaminopyrimidine deaminase/5-amino-6-(5-phosphoribosylamino)uracil reductase
VFDVRLHDRAQRDQVAAVSADAVDAAHMGRAIEAAASVRRLTSPNPWVGCVVVTADGHGFDGATGAPGEPHAEIQSLAAAGDRARGATLYTTLEPCAHHGRTPPCTAAIIAAGVARVVVGTIDPDPNVAGRGIDQLRRAGITVDVGVAEADVHAQLLPYLTHRRTGRPFVVLKLAASVDGGIAAPDGSSRWITSQAARNVVHGLRAESDAVCVGAGTVRADDPELTVRHIDGADPLRVVLGTVPADAKVQPCLEWSGDLGDLLDHLGGRGVVQLLVEGGATVAASFHREGLVDRYVIHLAPCLFGGDDARPLFAGAGAATIEDVWRGCVVSTRMVGDDVEIVLEPK